MIGNLQAAANRIFRDFAIALPMFSLLGLMSHAYAETVAFRSGADPCGPCAVSLHCVRLSPPPTAVSPAEFAAASGGLPPLPIGNPSSSWLRYLPGDSLAVWVNETGSAGTGRTVLYAITFELTEPFERASLELEFAVDNFLGYSRTGQTPGIYLNGQGLPSSIGGDYRASTTWTWSEVAGLLRQGSNTLYLYARDTGIAAGVIFSGRVVTSGVGSPITCDLRGFPVIRAREAAQYTVQLHNTTDATVPLVYVCVTIAAPGAIVHAGRQPDPVPWPVDGPSEPSFTSSDSTHAYVHFFVANLPPGSDAGSFPFEIEAPLSQGARSGSIAMSVAVIPFGINSDLKTVHLLTEADFQCLRNFLVAQIGRSVSDLVPFVECATTVLVGLPSAIGAHIAQFNGLLAYFTSQQLFQDLVDEFLVPCALSAGVGRAVFARGAWRLLGWPLAVAGAGCMVYEFYQACGNMSTTYPSCIDAVVGLVSSLDPNALINASSSGSSEFTYARDTISYVVCFENSPNASAAARVVAVDCSLDTMFHDPETLVLRAVSFGSHHFNLTGVPIGTQVDFDLRPDRDLVVRFESSLVANSGHLMLWFRTLDPVTMAPPADPFIGFLPPNTAQHQGEGAVHYSIGVRSVAASGTAIESQASILFDANEAISTEIARLVVDNDPPSIEAELDVTDAVRGPATITYSSRDDASGVASVGLGITMDGQDPVVIALPTTSGTVPISQTDGRRHEYFLFAIDAAGRRSEDLTVGSLQFEAGPPERWLRLTPNPAVDPVGIMLIGFRGQNVTIDIFDLAGHSVRQVPRQEILLDSHVVPWGQAATGIRPLPAGVYFLRVTTDDGYRYAQKFVLLR